MRKFWGWITGLFKKLQSTNSKIKDIQKQIKAQRSILTTHTKDADKFEKEWHKLNDQGMVYVKKNQLELATDTMKLRDIAKVKLDYAKRCINKVEKLIINLENELRGLDK